MMSEFKIKWSPSPSHYDGRKGHKPIAIVNHITAGSMPGCLNWLQNPKAQASSNYLVTRDGEIHQLVKDEDAAWANGGVNKPDWELVTIGENPNRFTLSIEHEGQTGDLTDIQFKATVFLHALLCRKWDIPIDEQHIIGHYRIDSVNRPYCPGPDFPWKRLFEELKGEVVNMELKQWQKKIGIEAVDSLGEKDLINNSEQWKDKLGEYVPNWLFFVMLDRITKN